MSVASEVILVHGLWYGPMAMSFLARQLEDDGFRVRKFSYRATATHVAKHAEKLLAFIRRGEAARSHLVGHSLGGLVIVKALAVDHDSDSQASPQLNGARVVLLGTPLRGSAVAQKVMQLPGGQSLFRKAAEDLCEGQPYLPEQKRIGLIAGSRSFGLGRLLGQSAEGSDGTVALEETDSPGLAARLILPVSHTGMLFSRRVARQTTVFLRSGQFSDG